MLDRDHSTDGRRVMVSVASIVLVMPVVSEVRRAKKPRRMLPELRRFVERLGQDRQARLAAARERTPAAAVKAPPVLGSHCGREEGQPTSSANPELARNAP